MILRSIAPGFGQGLKTRVISVHMINSMRLVAVFTGLLAWTLSAQTFTAKVVGVHDGDTITVYDRRGQTKIRQER